MSLVDRLLEAERAGLSVQGLSVDDSLEVVRLLALACVIINAEEANDRGLLDRVTALLGGWDRVVSLAHEGRAP